MNLKTKINQHLKQMAYTPKVQIKRLAIGTGISTVSILLLLLVSHLEIQWLFYLLATFAALGIIYALPGYLGMWLWRMRALLFKKNNHIKKETPFAKRNDKVMKLWLIIIGILLVLLFVGGPGINDARIIKAIWQSGHFVLFAMAVFVIMRIKLVEKQKWFHLFVATGIFSSWFGVATEALQLSVGRDFEFADIGNDIIGGYAGFFLSRLILLSDQNLPNKKSLQLAYALSIITLALLGTRSATITLLDQQNVKSSFPVLSDFETPFEVTRWDFRSAELSMTESPEPNETQSLKVVFFPDRYPDITLKDFVSDWSNYKQIKFSLFNAQVNPINMIMKVYDDTHLLNGYRYEDRFNRKIRLQPGWNQFEFLLETIKQSPQKREMDLTSISSFSLFMVDLKEPVTIFIDDLYLSKK